MKILITLSLILTFGCSSNTQKISKADAKEEIVQRSDELSGRPDWAHEDQVFTTKDGKMFSLGTITIYGDQKIDAGYKIAESTAKSNFAKAIEQKLEFTLQNADEGLSFDSTVLRYMSTEVSKIEAREIIAQNHYWEKYVTIDNSGLVKSYYRIFVRVSMPEIAFKETLARSLKSGVESGKLSQEFSDKINNKWKDL